MNKIVIVIGGLGGGGAENVCVNIANGLSKSGWDVEVVTLNLRNDIYSQRLLPGVRLTNLNIKNVRFSFIGYMKYIYKTRPSLVLSFNYQISIILIVIRRVLKVKFRLVSRNINFLSEIEKHQKDFWNKSLVSRAVKSVYPRSDLIIAQSGYMKADLVQYLNINPGKVRVIHNPISKEIEEFLKHRNPDGRKVKNYILCVGRLEEQKDFSTAIEAFSKVAVDFPGLELWIAGKGSLESALKELARRCNVLDRVKFLGFTKELIPCYLGAKFTLLTSLYEGFPNVLIESIALGVPVVSFDCPSGPAEIVIEGVNGYLVENRSMEKLVLAMNCALNTEWSESNIRETSRQFSSEAILKKYVEAILS